MKKLRIAAIAFTLLGFAGFFGALICHVWLSGVFPKSIELPLAEAGGLAVDDDGRIYTASASYARLQAYDSDGRFLWGAYLGATKPSIRISMNDNKVEIFTSKSFISLDRDGNILHKEPFEPSGYSASDQNTAEDNDGNIYYIRHPSIWPQVVKITPSGDEQVVISPKFYLWMISGPIPAWFFVLIGMLFNFIYLQIFSRPGSNEEDG